ncbi:MAG: prepilin-type N-terminal cleavage/methylation domain-containing protein [Sedimenticolaceae bacterium]
MMTKQTGLTLIEIMIAVAILAILSAIAVPIYQGYVVEARYGTALKDIRQMQLILDDLALENSLAAIEPAGYTAGDDADVYTNDNGIQVAGSAPAGTQAWLDPWGNVYRYRRTDGTANPQEYVLSSAGPDGTHDTADDALPN